MDAGEPAVGRETAAFGRALWRSDFASAKRGNEMHFAVLANGIEHAAGGYFTVD